MPTISVEVTKDDVIKFVDEHWCEIEWLAEVVNKGTNYSPDELAKLFKYCYDNGDDDKRKALIFMMRGIITREENR